MKRILFNMAVIGLFLASLQGCATNKANAPDASSARSPDQAAASSIHSPAVTNNSFMFRGPGSY